MVKQAVTCTLSIVSHGHSVLVARQLESLIQIVCSDRHKVEVILTLNIPEPDLMCALGGRSWPFELKLIHNVRPQGFGANHNQAFQQAQGQWFGVINPDIIWLGTALPGQASFWEWLESVPLSVGMVAPAQVDMLGQMQDSVRQLITPWSLAVRVCRRVFRCQRISGVADSVETADWVNAACLFIRADTYRILNGFDARYFMYCEDADICLRLQLAGFRMVHADFTVIHDAQRNTTRNASHLIWHMTSLIKFWASSACWRYGWWKFSGKPPIKRQTTKSASP